MLRYPFALIVGALFDLPIAVFAAGYDNSHDSVSVSQGISTIGQLFGGTTSVLVLLGALAVLAGLYIAQRILSRDGHHDAVSVITLVVAVLTGIVGLHWIHVSVTMLVPLAALTYLAVQTAVIGRVSRR